MASINPFLSNIASVGHTSYPSLPTYYSLNIELKSHGSADSGNIPPVGYEPASDAAAAQALMYATTAYNPPIPELPKRRHKEKEQEHPAIEGPPPRPPKPLDRRRTHKRSASYSGPPEPAHNPHEDEEPKPAPPPPPTPKKPSKPPKDKTKKIPITKPTKKAVKHKRTKSNPPQQPEPTPMEAEKPVTPPSPSKDRSKKIPIHKPTKKAVKHRRTRSTPIAMDAEPTAAPPTEHQQPIEGGGQTPSTQVKNLTLGKRKQHPTKPKDMAKNQSYTSQLNRLTRRLHKEMDGNADPKKIAYLREAIQILQDLRLGKYKADIAKRGLEKPKDKPIPKGRTKKQQKLHKKKKALRKTENEVRLLKQAKKTGHGITSDQIYDLAEAKANRYRLRKALKRGGVYKKKK